MTTALSLIQNELAALISANKLELAEGAYLPNVLVGLVVDYDFDKEAFWKKKCLGYFPKINKPKQQTFEACFEEKLDNLLFLVASNGGALKFASEDLRDNTEVVKIAVAQDGRALQFASVRIREGCEKDPDFLLKPETTNKFIGGSFFKSEPDQSFEEKKGDEKPNDKGSFSNM